MDVKNYIDIYNKQQRKLDDAAQSLSSLKKTNQVGGAPISSGASFFSKLRSGMKRIIAKSVGWYCEGIYEQQNIINRRNTQLLEELTQNQMLMSEMLEMIAKENGIDLPQRKAADGAALKGRVFQLVSELKYGDAVGNDVMSIKRALTESGYETAVYAYKIHPRVPLSGVYHVNYLKDLQPDDLVIYHVASEEAVADVFMNLTCKKVVRYHNITPAEFFKAYDKSTSRRIAGGIGQVISFGKCADYAMADSEFNKQDLLKYGYKCPIDVVPVLVPFEDYEQAADQNVIDRFSDGKTNVLFVGRIAPNKKFEDLIKCFAEYKRSFNSNSRLILAGSYDENDPYYRHLLEVVKSEGVDDVQFTGHISFAGILGCYRAADIFLCLSEHEGFCVPLLEAMKFELPIIAFNSTAVPYTLGDAGILVDDKSSKNVAKELDRLVKSPELQKKLIENGKTQLEKYQYETVKEQIVKSIEKMLDCE